MSYLRWQLKRRTWESGPSNLNARFFIATLLLAIIGGMNCLGGDIVWTNTAGGNWGMAENWSPNQIPSVADNAFITNSGTFTITLSSFAPCGALTIAGGSGGKTLSINSSGVLSVIGTATLNSNSVILLNGGTIRGGTIGSTNNPALIAAPFAVNSAPGGLLDGVTLNAAMRVKDQAMVTVTNGLVLNSVITLGGTSWDYDYGRLDFNGSQTLSGNGVILLDYNVPLPGYVQNTSLQASLGSILTIGSNILIHGRAGTVGNTGSAIINQGTILSDVPNGLVYLIGSLTNQGILMAISGATLNINSGNWSSSGTINVNNATVNLGGRFTTAGLGTINRTGGTVNLTGTLDNTGTTLDLDRYGPWVISGGTIRGGTITSTNNPALIGAPYNNPTTPGGTLDGVTLNAAMSVRSQSYVTVTNGLVLNSIITLGTTNYQYDSGRVYFNGNQSMTGTGEILFGGFDINYGILYLGELNGPAGDGMTLTIGPGITIHGRGGALDPRGGTIINQGKIIADVTSGQIYVSYNYGNFTNMGSMMASNGARLTVQNANWANFGSVIANNGTLDLGIYIANTFFTNVGTINVTNSNLYLGGQFTTAGLGTINRSGSTVYLTGILDNRGTTLDLDRYGPWVISGGTIRGGTILSTNNPALVGGPYSGNGAPGGILDGVTLNAAISIKDLATLTVTNGLVLNSTMTIGGTNYQADYGRVWFSGNQALLGTGEINLNPDANTVVYVGISPNGGSGIGMMLTIGSGITIHGRGGNLNANGGTVINQGQILSEVTNGRISVTGNFTNAGLMTVMGNARLSFQNGAWVNAGTITAVGGTLDLGDVYNQPWSNIGAINVTNSTVNLGGNFTQAGLGTFNRTGGTVNLTGTLSGGLALDTATGSWNLSGTVNGGTMIATGGAQLIGNNGTLSGVTLGSDLNLTNTAIGVRNGLMLVDGAAVRLNQSGGFGCYLNFYGVAQTLGGTGEVVFNSSVADYARLQIVEGSLTTDPSIAIRTGSGGGYLYTANAASFLINQGTIQADRVGETLTVSVTAFTNYGTLQALNGGMIDSTVANAYSTSTGIIRASAGSTVSFRGNVNFSNDSFLASQASGTVRIGGSLLGSTYAPVLFRPQGTTTLGGSGNVVSPQFLEVMSPDAGTNVNAFSGPFAYGSLALANNTYVRLVDQSDNSPGNNTEAFYANSLIIPSGCTLDLNGLKIYTRTAQISGTITNGTIAQIPDSGPITLGTFTPGSIGVSGELDEWTFFGRAGQNITIAVDPGSGAVLPPQLGYADVRLVGLTNNVLAQASNTVANETVALTDMVLPSDGTHRIQIRAPANQVGSTGNYFVTLWEVTPDIAPLTLNQTHYGKIETPYAVDRWTFSAVAGQQVQFDLIAASAAGVAFDLRGPNGPLGFTNLVSDSGLVNLTSSGNYTLTAHGTGGAYDIAYAFRLVESVQTDLPLGTNFSSQFSGNGQAQIFKINITNTGPVRITLQNSGAGNRTELYVSRSGAPTRGGFDLSSASGPGANRTLIIPSAAIGTYYILVYGDNIPTPGSFTIQATAVGVIVSDINPKSQGNNVPMMMTFTGVGFEAGTTVQLLGGATITATNVSIDSYSQITAIFPPSAAPPGNYSVHVHQPDGDDDVFPNAFQMLAPGVANLETKLILPSALGRHAVATIYVEYANTGNAAMPAPLLQLHSTDSDDSDSPILTMDQSRVIQNYWSVAMPPGTANEMFILGSGAQPGLLNPGERIRVPVYYLGLQQPWNFGDTQVELEIRYWTADDLSPIDWAAREESLRPSTLDSNTWNVVFENLTSALTNTGEYIRMLSDNAQFLGRLGERVTDVDKLWNFELQQAYGFSVLQMVDSAVDSSVPTPGVPLDFSRRFSSSVRSRNSSGWFGKGWFTPWQTRIVTSGAVSGNQLSLSPEAKVVGEGGSVRFFTLDSRNDNFFAPPGDSSELRVRFEPGPNFPIAKFELFDPNGTITGLGSAGITYVQDPNSNRVTTTFSIAQNPHLLRMDHSSGAWISLSYNGAGRVQSATNSAGRSVTYTYDPSSTYLQTVASDDGKITSYTYETAGTLAQRHALTSVTRGGVTRHFTYDTRGRLETSYIGAGDQLVRYSYDSAGGIDIIDAQGTNHVFFNHHGLLAKVTDALGNTTTSEFDDNLRLKRMVTPTGESQSFTWCNCGSMTSLTDELGNKTAFQYDNPFKRMTGFTDARGNATGYAYDANGNLLSTTYPNNSVERVGSYTASGLPQSYTNRRSQPISYTYTSAGLVSRQSFTNGTYADFNYDLRGNLTNVTEHTIFGTNKLTSYAYNYAIDGDRLRQVMYPNNRWMAIDYDTFGRRQRMTDSTGWTNKYEYDAAGRLWRMRDGTNNLMVEYLYNPAGRLQRINKGNGTYTTYNYDPAGQLLHLTNFAPNATVNSRFDYTYDSRGRRRTMGTTDGDWTYNYDGSGQLTRAIFNSSNLAIANQNLQYNYDAVGNRTSTVINGGTTNYVANNLNQYTSVGGAAYQCDADGNLIFDGLRNYTYDTQSRLDGVTGPEGVTQIEYDALGNRTATVLNGQRNDYLLDPTGIVNIIGELDGSGGVTTRYTQGRGLVAKVSGAGERLFYDFDAMGSSSSLTGNSGVQANRYAYSPYGEQLFANETVTNPFQFVGEFGVASETSGLVFMRHRFYLAERGRLLSKDLVGSQNLYTYVINNPLSYVDPLGLSECSALKAIGMASKVVRIGVPLAVALEVAAPAAAAPLVGIGWAGKMADLYYDAKCNAKNGTDNGADGGFCAPPASPAEIEGLVGGSGGKGGGGGGSVGGCCGGKCGGPPGGGPPGGPGPGGPGSGGDSGIPNSQDPNQKLGPMGVGPSHHILLGATLPYRVDFENDAVASAPAQQVTITDQLSTNLDWQTFQLTDIGFGDQMIIVPPNSQHFETKVVMTCCGAPFEAQIEAGINLASGQVYATFRSIDPATSLPPTVSIGFLPPEDGTGRGQGHFSYLINAKTNLSTGTQIRNVALISFDNQPSIATDQIDPHNPGAGVDPNKQAFNTIDAGTPSSSVAALSAQSGRAFLVQWPGQDDVGGSGIESYDVLVSTNGGPFGYWFSQTNITSAVFHGQPGNTYAFYSIARDKVGFVEAVPVIADAQTTIITNAPQLASVNDTAIQPGSNLSVTNVVQGTAVGSFRYSLGPNPPGGMTVSATNGILNWTPDCSQGNSTNIISVWVTDSARTNISDLVSFLVAVDRCVEPSFGQVMLLAGTSGKVPINLIAKAALTNLQATLVSPPGRLLNISIEPIVPEICATSVTPLTNNMHRLQFTTCTNQSLTGTRQIAWLHFTAADLASAFVSLSLTNLSASDSHGNPVANFAPQSGRVIVVSDEPLLECVRKTNGQPLILLYGKPAPDYSIEAKTNAAALTWQTALNNLTMTNLLLEITPPASTSVANFYRAKRVGSITPARFLGASLLGSSNIILQVRGLANRNYGIQTSTNLASPSWQNISNVTCNVDGLARFTNSLATPAKERYYRTVVSD